jgi:hypothetical protein
MSPKFDSHNVRETRQCDISQKDPFCERPFMVNPTGHCICSNVLLVGLLRSQQLQYASYPHWGAMRWSGRLGSAFLRVRIFGTSTTDSMTIHDTTISVMLDNAKTTAARLFLVSICFRRSCFGSKLFQSAWQSFLDTKPKNFLPWLRHCSMPRSLSQTEHISSHYK